MGKALNLLKRSNFLEDLTREEFNEYVLPFLQKRRYKTHGVILQKDSVSPGIYFLVSGRVKLSSYSDGRELILGYVNSGHIFGHESALSGKPSSMDCIANERCNAFMIPLDPAVELLSKNKNLAMKVLRDAFQRLENTRILMTGLVYQPARQKVAGALWYLEKVNNNNYGLVKAQRSDIARLAAVTRETATRIVKDMEKEGIVSTEGKFAIIRDHKKLAQIKDQYL